MDLGLRGLTAVVTGGTKGIGRSIVQTLAREGAHVAFCARNDEEVRSTESEFARQGLSVTGRALDVADALALGAFVEEVRGFRGGLDVVVANVSALAIDNEETNWSRCFDVDLMGTVRLVNAALPALEKSAAAAIVTISSVSAREIDFAAGPYGAFKAALVHYTQGLALHLAAKGIRANTVSPGNTYFEGGVWHQIEKDNPALFREAMALNPSGRMGIPQEVANAVAFLSSPVASFISGTNLVVDGALTRGVQL